MFEAFSLSRVSTGEAELRVRHGGSGPPLLLLHGHPQTHMMWGKIADDLARDFTVIAPDLRGYGRSSKPPTSADHAPYSKRAMARDQIALMNHFGFGRFAVAGHDRGGRVAYRLALDHPDAVTRLAVLDILPTAEHFARTDMAFAMGYWHWFFLAQPHPVPERLIAADPELFYFRNGTAFFAPQAIADYREAIRDPATVHAMCEDYRAGIGIDRALDEADRGRTRIACPLLALWGSKGPIGRWYPDMEAIWREWADDVTARAVPSGHYLAEEAPEETLAALRDFFLKG